MPVIGLNDVKLILEPIEVGLDWFVSILFFFEEVGLFQFKLEH